jgi:hypothetical protein
MKPAIRSPLIAYRDGSVHLRETAWQTLMDWGDLEEGTAAWEEAYAVARETMARARENVERIIDFLTDHGYAFEPALGVDLKTGLPWRPPAHETAEQLVHLTSMVGPLPLSLRAWYEVVGAVSLQGRFPDLCDEEQGLPVTDPLMVASLDAVLRQLDHYRQEVEYWRANDPQVILNHPDFAQPGWPLVVAPDIYHKANISGGVPYQVRVPDRRADTPLLNVRIMLPAPPGGGRPYHEVEVAETFVQYLRRSVAWAGFPGHALSPYGAAADSAIERLKPLFPQMLSL